MQIPTDEQFFANHGRDRTKPDIAFLKNHFYREGRLSEEQALWILEKGTEVLRKEGNVLQVGAPITGEYSCSEASCHHVVVSFTDSQGMLAVCGDIHGQYVRSRCSFLSFL